jgi:endonuclease I
MTWKIAMNKTFHLIACLLLALAGPARADSPPVVFAEPLPEGYYAKAEGLQGGELREALHDIVKRDHRTGAEPHKHYRYETARKMFLPMVDGQENHRPLYGTGERGFNCEHVWPRSRGAKPEPMESDLHHLFESDTQWNALRSSLPFGTVEHPDQVSPTGAKVKRGIAFEPPGQEKGYVARAIFYFHVRYGNPLADGMSGDGRNGTDIDDKMGNFSDLLAWHEQYPPDGFERERNGRVFQIQGNRNPFIDRPEFVEALFQPSEKAANPAPSEAASNAAPDAAAKAPEEAAPSGFRWPGED